MSEAKPNDFKLLLGFGTLSINPTYMIKQIGYQLKPGHFVNSISYIEPKFKESKMLLPNYFALLRDFARLLVPDDQKSRASKVSRVKLVASKSRCKIITYWK